MALHDALLLLSEGRTLDEEQAASALRAIMQGDAPAEETAGFLMGLRARGETDDELVGFTRVMRAFAVSVDAGDPDAIDLCGTGGDHAGTFNISTTAAFVCAGAGVTVAKHGNRSVSSKSGSADVLEALGVHTTLGKEGVETCLRETGIAFLFAPYFHPAMKHVMPVRRALGVRTFFNILGPLCNPAGVRRQLVGAFSKPVARQMVEILRRLDARHVVTCHGADGLDEFSLTSETTFYRHHDGRDTLDVSTFSPESLGLERAESKALQGGTAEENAALLRDVLSGAPGPARDVSALNAAFALSTTERYDSLQACLDAAFESIDSGAALARLDALVSVSQEAARARA